jgi:hypothetical protein
MLLGEQGSFIIATKIKLVVVEYWKCGTKTRQATESWIKASWVLKFNPLKGSGYYMYHQV